jgi:methionyl-tRNA formyltransferase
MQPWPTPYTFLHRTGQPPLRVIITKADEFPIRYHPSVPPGRVLPDPIGENRLLVTAGELGSGERSVVDVYELQPAGKRRKTAEDFLRGRPVQEGDRFGPETLA